MTTTLPLFWHLSSASKKERIAASTKLVGILEQFQEKFVTQHSFRTSNSEDQDDDNGDNRDEGSVDSIDALNAQDMSYSIRRLVRGLASPRESSRLGFAVVLAEVSGK
jgi:DNA polymerase phi